MRFFPLRRMYRSTYMAGGYVDGARCLSGFSTQFPGIGANLAQDRDAWARSREAFVKAAHEKLVPSRVGEEADQHG